MKPASRQAAARLVALVVLASCDDGRGRSEPPLLPGGSLAVEASVVPAEVPAGAPCALSVRWSGAPPAEAHPPLRLQARLVDRDGVTLVREAWPLPASAPADHVLLLPPLLSPDTLRVETDVVDAEGRRVSVRRTAPSVRVLPASKVVPRFGDGSWLGVDRAPGEPFGRAQWMGLSGEIEFRNRRTAMVAVLRGRSEVDHRPPVRLTVAVNGWSAEHTIVSSQPFVLAVLVPREALTDERFESLRLAVDSAFDPGRTVGGSRRELGLRLDAPFIDRAEDVPEAVRRLALPLRRGDQ